MEFLDPSFQHLRCGVDVVRSGDGDHQARGTGAVLELERGSFGDDLAVVDHDHVVGELVRLVEVLRGEQQRGAFPDQVPQDVPEFVAGPRVQSGGGLVEEQHGRRRHQARREVEPAAHSAGVALGDLGGGIGEGELLEQLVGTGLDLLLGQSVQVTDEPEVLTSGQELVDGRGLRGQAHRLAHFCGLALDVVPRHPCGSRCGRAQRGHHADRGGLSGPVRAEQTKHRPGGDGEGDAVDSSEVAELLDELLGFDRGRRCVGTSGWMWCGHLKRVDPVSPSVNN